MSHRIKYPLARLSPAKNELVVVIAEPKALGMAVWTRKAGKRITRLAERLMADSGAGATALL